MYSSCRYTVLFDLQIHDMIDSLSFNQLKRREETYMYTMVR